MSSKKKRKDKYFTGKLHLILGLTSGLVVLLLGITGCLFVFNQEVTNWLRHDQMHVQQVTQNRLPVSRLWPVAQQALGSKEIYSAIISTDPTASVEFKAFKKSETEHLFYFDNIEYYYSVYVDPYSGKVLGIYDEEADFFNIVKMLHWSLLMKESVGQTITGWATFIFVIMLITGIILWWPKNKAARKQRVWFQWKESTKWRRKNYDLHNIAGFYVSVVALIVALTGMVWAFTWFQSVVYVIGSGSITPPEFLKEQSVKGPGELMSAYDKVSAHAAAHYADAAAYQLAKPKAETDPINVYVQLKEGTYYKNHSAQYNRYTGAFLKERRHSEKNFGEKLVTANYDIHVGAILGLPGKILAFIASFVCSMLPVTGFLIWRGRNNKKAKAKPAV